MDSPSSDSLLTNDSIEDIWNRFRILNSDFNNLMSTDGYNCTDGRVKPILKEMLDLINGNHNIHLDSIINTSVFLQNLQRALTQLENFPVILLPEIEFEHLADGEHCGLNFSVIPTEGETSLQRFTLGNDVIRIHPFNTFGGLEEKFWPEVQINPSQEPDANEDAPKLTFSIGGREPDFYFSVYQALLVHKLRESGGVLPNVFQQLWTQSHVPTFERYNKAGRYVDDISDFEKESKIVLQLLRKTCNLGIGCQKIDFVNQNLDQNLNRQLSDILAGASPSGIPPWWSYLAFTYPFLFTYETRCKFFQFAAYGKEWPTYLGTIADTELNIEQKCTVFRNQILECAEELMDKHANKHVILKVEFEGEIGTGLGPTLEFYSLISKEFQRTDLEMWRQDDDSHGLFPRPRFPSSEAVTKKFVLLGQLVGKAIQNGRLLDLPLSRAFYKLILGKELSIHDIQTFDPYLGRTLLEFNDIVNRKKRNESDLRYKGLLIEDLYIDFTLPGYEDFILTDDQQIVNLENLEQYVLLVKDATVGSGISDQIAAFKEGFNQVFVEGAWPGIQNLCIFTEEELEAILCGDAKQDKWSFEQLSNHVTFGDGYTPASDPIVKLLEILQEFDQEQRRGFLQFVTATPRLPSGGFASLDPKLKVVRQLPPTQLPSVMTCFNLLKLPPYPSKETMKEKLLYAITEGHGSFHLL